MARHCLKCGNVFDGAAAQKYCSHQCYLLTKKRALRACVVCAQMFAPPSQSTKACSKECADEARRRKMEATRARNERPCVLCGTRFRGKPNRMAVGWARYCSRACAYRDSRREARLVCAHCHAPFVVSGTRRKNRYCSHTCSRAGGRKREEKTCATCAAPFAVIASEAHRRYCSKTCSDDARSARYLLCSAPVTIAELAEIADCGLRTMRSRICKARVKPGTEVPTRLFVSVKSSGIRERATAFRPSLQCERCSMQFTPKRSVIQRFCSITCATRATGAARRDRLTIKCEGCESAFEARRKPKRRFCTRACFLRSWRRPRSA